MPKNYKLRGNGVIVTWYKQDQKQ